MGSVWGEGTSVRSPMHGQWRTFVPVDRYLVPSKHHSRSEHTSCGPVGSSREAQRLSSDIYSKFDVDRWLLFASKWGAKLCSVWEQRTKRSAELDSANVRCITRKHFIARCSASRHGGTTVWAGDWGEEGQIWSNCTCPTFDRCVTSMTIETSCFLKHFNYIAHVRHLTAVLRQWQLKLHVF